MSTSRVPKYSRQRESGRADRAYVRINGRKIKLGLYGSPESKAKYAELISGKSVEPTELVDAPFAPSLVPTVNEILVSYIEYAQTYYRQPNGELAREYGHICEAAKFLRHKAGRLLADKFGPQKLKAIRQQLVDNWQRPIEMVAAHPRARVAGTLRVRTGKVLRFTPARGRQVGIPTFGITCSGSPMHARAAGQRKVRSNFSARLLTHTRAGGSRGAVAKTRSFAVHPHAEGRQLRKT